MTPEKIARLRDLAEIMPAPWYPHHENIIGQDVCFPCPDARLGELICEMRNSLDELLDENKRLRQVLSWYGDEENHFEYEKTMGNSGTFFTSKMIQDYGKRAREAIGEK